MVSKFNVLGLGIFIIAIGMVVGTFPSAFNSWVIAIPVVILGILIIFFIKPIQRFVNDWSKE